MALCDKNAELGELLSLEPVSSVIKKGQLRCFGHDEHEVDTSLINHCMTIEVDGTRQETSEEDLVR